MDLQILKSKKPSQYFPQLCREIIGQQLSGKVARVINKRFTTLFPKGIVSSKHLLSLKDQELRDIGMSWAKVKYVKNLAQAVENKELSFKQFPQMDDQSITNELTKVKGIGPWTAEMFLIFTLGREDVFSKGDLGLRKAIKRLHHFSGKNLEEKTKRIIQKWSPYKSYACLALWKSLDQ